MTGTTHPRLPPRRGGGAGTWWSKAVLRAVEEAAFGESDLRAGRALARAGAVGSITVSDGGAVAAVSDGQDAFTVEVTVPASSCCRTAVSSARPARGRGGSTRARTRWPC